jgi:hypothetical protein
MIEEMVTRPTVLFVLGMPRSGTAALTRVLSLCGATLPDGMIGGRPANPSGFWEPRKTFHLNGTILHRHGSSMWDPTLRLQQEGAFSAEEKTQYTTKIQAFLNTLPAAPVIVIKDLQITALPGIWFNAAQQTGFDTAAIIALRHPQEVIASLTKMAPKAPPELSAALWLKYTLLAEKHTCGLPRVFVEYPNLLDNWHLEVKRISAALNIDLNPDQDAIEKFLQHDQRHQRHHGPIPEPFGNDWMTTTFGVLQLAARDQPCAIRSTLDPILDAYQASEHAFRTALESFHWIHKHNRLITPSIIRLALEVSAITHRRRGMWA